MTPEAEISQLKQRVGQLEQQLASLAMRSTVFDNSSRDVTPAGFVEITVGGSLVRLPYFVVGSN